MGKILSDLGVTWEGFIAQVCIFLILYFVLSKFAFGPILKILQERRNRIAESEADRKKVKAQLANAEAAAKQHLDEAFEKASSLVNEARESAAALAAKKTEEADRQAASILKKARESAILERDRTMTDLKKDFGRLVVQATGQVTGKVLTKADQDKINKEAAAEVAR